MDLKGLLRLVGALLTAGAIGGAGYLWAGVEQGKAAAADVRLLKVELQGELARIRDEQQRTREDIQKLTRALEERSPRADR